MTAETTARTDPPVRTKEEMARHAIAMQLHSIRAACEAALASLAMLDSGQAFERPPTRRPPNSETEAQFFGKIREKQMNPEDPARVA